MTNEKMTEWIDRASYTDLLNKWRFEPSGSPWFQGSMGDYYKKVMLNKKNKLSNVAQVLASKTVGWNK